MRIFDGCAWCGGEVVGTLLLESGTTEQVNGRRVWQRERRAPVCAHHRDTLVLNVKTKSTLAAQEKAAARAWRERQTVLFDGRAFQVGSSQKRGWWAA